MSATVDIEHCYALPCDILGVVTFNEVYIMSTAAKWPERRKAAIIAHPELFTWDNWYEYAQEDAKS